LTLPAGCTHFPSHPPQYRSFKPASDLFLRAAAAMVPNPPAAL
jgi:hypothetical protein